MARCEDCPWKAGLRDETTLCVTCSGSGEVEDKEPVKEPVKPSAVMPTKKESK